MDTRQLRTFVAIAENGTFARAASVVNLTPSAVSQQIYALEQELDTKLFNRDSRPPSLNLQGLKLLETAKQILALVDETRGVLSGKQMTGTLNVGSVRTSTIGLLPRAIVALRQEFPELSVNLRVGMSSTLISDVNADRLDMAVVAEHTGVSRNLLWSPFIREPLMVIAPPGTPWMPARELLEALPFVRFGSDVPLGALINNELARLGITVQDIAEIDTVPAIVECVAAGLGVSIVPDIAVRENGRDMLKLPFGEPQVFRQIGMIHRAGSPKAELFVKLHNKLAEMAGEFGVYREGGAVDGS
ncbi:LysR family transcriptional regulator [Halomonas sp. MCCC 1A17488]|uniref:LysR family transcriptional regulator n=1 Tax=unclassified Halomonas TaxID=2609666 RepID=UPI0018D246C8|nr:MULTISPECIES: LysR family transcriptional regulator [unclassified Halomonas]MCE8016117.1 LysR family transcriptional regulator [Halomonas sp. MCCC 1A17488]MCG3239450.1 LysR family transcriptional regulator [Halomonas sp. MCCC 1A17488]QPP50624.1 LysR family transcriptional regulator [Halomonas sp. SS10-MC5]